MGSTLGQQALHMGKVQKLSFLLLPNAFPFLSGSAEPKSRGELCKQGPEHLLRVTDMKFPPKKTLEQQAEVGQANRATRAERVPPASRGEKEGTELCWGGWGPPQRTAAIVVVEHEHGEARAAPVQRHGPGGPRRAAAGFQMSAPLAHPRLLIPDFV